MPMLALVTAAMMAAQLQVDAPDMGTSTVINAQRSLAVEASTSGKLPTPPSWAELLRAQVTQTLQGFDTVVLTQINATFGSENLPIATGSPVQPGIYITGSPSELLVFDGKIADLQDGVVPPGPASRECKSGCKALLWSALRKVWLTGLEEAQRLALELPTRVAFGLEASVPARTLVELAYAVAETRPGQPPSFDLLVNGGNAGLRARPFFLLPPAGIRVAPGDSVLGLRVTLGPGEQFELSAAHPRFSRNIRGTGWKELAKQLVAIKKQYPNKGTLIIDVGEGTVGDVVMVMVASQKQFPRVVVTDGLPVKWG